MVSELELRTQSVMTLQLLPHTPTIGNGTPNLFGVLPCQLTSFLILSWATVSSGAALLAFGFPSLAMGELPGVWFLEIRMESVSQAVGSQQPFCLGSFSLDF